MENEFVSYEQAVALKEIGFDGDALKVYSTKWTKLMDEEYAVRYDVDYVLSPLKQQVFRWFREKYELYYHIFPLQITASDKTGYRYSWEIYNHTPEWIANDEELLGSLTYEEAESACIDKLIELAKQQDNGK